VPGAFAYLQLRKRAAAWQEDEPRVVQRPVAVPRPAPVPAPALGRLEIAA
jgi:hypothetical protein